MKLQIELPKIESILKIEGRTKFVVLDVEAYRKLILNTDITIKIDEVDYLAANKDVADAVKAGSFKSATDHYLKHGYFEGRVAKRINAPVFMPMSAPTPATAAKA